MTTHTRFHWITAAIVSTALVACGGGSSGGSENDDDEATSFPTGLAVASPTARSDSGAARIIAGAVAPAIATSSQYEWASELIAAVLNGTTQPADAFDPEMLMRTATNANCYGPTLDYADHPDYVSGTDQDGELPSGDLGIWKDTDVDGNACATAELNQQLGGVSNRATMGLVALASMLHVANDDGVAMPAAGASINLLTNMNAAGIPSVMFTQATLALSADGGTWSYDLGFTYAQPSGGGGTVDRTVELSLDHTPTSDSVYRGIMTYRVEADAMGGNCGMVVSGATNNGTLYYNRTSATAIFVNAREGGYCGDVAAEVAADTDIDGTSTYQFLNPADKFDELSNPNGWANNFNMFSAAFNPSTLEGDYVYAWQAGMGDSHARVLQLSMNANAADGEAYFGFGDAIDTTDGSILGMICNWAGPGNTHTPQPYAQRQFFTYNTTLGVFEIGTGASDIVYAPTNTCLYDGTGTFDYDRDLDGTLSDADDIKTVLSSGTASSTQLILDLMGINTAATIQEAITNRGFALPDF